MTSRSEKPSPTESSTDTIIAALDIVAQSLDLDEISIYKAMAVREAALRLDKLERELSVINHEYRKIRLENEQLRGEK